MGTGAGPDLAGLHVLADVDPRWRHAATRQAEAACAGGARVVQLRAKDAPDEDVLRVGQILRRLTREAGVLFFVNDRFDLALACDADGVHLGQDDLPPARLPAGARERLRVGLSTHDLEQAERARGEGVDYVALGPVFGTTSKDSPYDARGLPLVRAVATRVAPLPLIAIGGIDATNAADVTAAGASGVAVISCVANAEDPVAAVENLVAALGARNG